MDMLNQYAQEKYRNELLNFIHMMRRVAFSSSMRSYFTNRNKPISYILYHGIYYTEIPKVIDYFNNLTEFTLETSIGLAGLAQSIFCIYANYYKTMDLVQPDEIQPYMKKFYTLAYANNVYIFLPEYREKLTNYIYRFNIIAGLSSNIYRVIHNVWAISIIKRIFLKVYIYILFTPDVFVITRDTGL